MTRSFAFHSKKKTHHPEAALQKRIAFRKTHLTLERLKELLHYAPDTGLFTRLVTVGSRGIAGAFCGTRRAEDGYGRIAVDGQIYLAHRLAYFYMTGEWPQYVDHVNTDKSDDRFCNLRPATMSQNLANRGATNRATSSVYKGVYFHKPLSKWCAQIKVNYKRIYIGIYDSEEEAARAYDEVALKNFGEYSRLNFARAA